MAKLNVTYPAVDVMVNGRAYRKVDRSAREGDVIVFTEEADYVTEGKPYLVNEIDSADDAQITDDDGDDFDTCAKEFEVYEKVTQVSVTPTSKYREVKRWAEKGERIRIVNRHQNEHSYEQGAEFVVDSVDGDGDVHVTFGGNDRKLVVLSEYAVLEPIAQPVVCAEVKRKANVGERIRIVNTSDHRWTNGEEFPVMDTGSGGDVYVKHPEGKRHGDGYARVDLRQYVVLEPVSTADPKRLTVGDYAKIITSAGRHNCEIGSVVKITVDDRKTMPYRAEKADGTTGGWMYESNVEPATEAEFLAQRQPAEHARLKAGDYAKVLAFDYTYTSDVTVGIVVEITETDHTSRPYRAKKLDGTRAGWFTPEQLALSTPEEVAQAEVAEGKRREEQRWNAIGRKVGEFKRGDIVEIASSDSYNGIVGAIEEVGTQLIGVREFNGSYRGPHMSDAILIVPVEQRFDTQSAAKSAA